jgi:hypothetical protein
MVIMVRTAGGWKARAWDGTGTNHDVHLGCERFFRVGYTASLITSWLPALGGVADKLQRGARVTTWGMGMAPPPC